MRGWRGDQSGLDREGALGWGWAESIQVPSSPEHVSTLGPDMGAELQCMGLGGSQQPA